MTASEEARTRRNAAWPHAPHVLDRAKIGRQREDPLSKVVTLRDRIITARAETLADAAVQLRRLVVMAVVEWEAGWLINSDYPTLRWTPATIRPTISDALAISS